MCDVYRNDVTCDFVELAICMVNVLNSFLDHQLSNSII